MYIKIMSQENMPDNDVWKHHQIIETKEYSFFFDDDNKMDAVRYFVEFSKSYRTIWLKHANVYIMNDSGKTINSFQPKPKNNLEELAERIHKDYINGIRPSTKLRDDQLGIDYMLFFQQQLKTLKERVEGKIISLDDFQALKDNYIIRVTGPRQSGKTEFCLLLNKEYKCINISSFGSPQIPNRIVREHLKDNNLPFILVYPTEPTLTIRDIFIERLKKRGSEEKFIEMYKDVYIDYYNSCESETVCLKYKTNSIEDFINGFNEEKKG